MGTQRYESQSVDVYQRVNSNQQLLVRRTSAYTHLSDKLLATVLLLLLRYDLLLRLLGVLLASLLSRCPLSGDRLTTLWVLVRVLPFCGNL